MPIDRELLCGSGLLFPSLTRGISYPNRAGFKLNGRTKAMPRKGVDF
jgi:hypothetical protein